MKISLKVNTEHGGPRLTLLATGILMMATAIIGCDKVSKSSGQYLGTTHAGGSAALDPASSDACPSDAPQGQLALNARLALQNFCYSCHGANGNSLAAPANVTDLVDLVRSGMVVPGSLSTSPLITAITSGKMPPNGSTALGVADSKAITDWVQGGAPATDSPTAATSCSSPGAVAGPPSSAELAIQDTLKTFCADCHTTGNRGGLTNITDTQGLIKQGLIVPGSLKWSVIYARLMDTNKPMPPSGKPRPSDDQIKALADWIVALSTAPSTPSATSTDPNASGSVIAGVNGATGTGTVTSTPSSGTISLTAQMTPSDVFTLVAQDLQRVAGSNLGNGAFTRYVSFAPLAGPGTPVSQVLALDNSFSRVLNSLSTNSRIAKPIPVDKDGLILRFDLRDYNFSQRDWESIIQAYPYAALQRSVSAAQTFLSLSQTSLPVVNGDWFIFTATQAPLYNQLLKLPGNIVGLQQILGINILQNIQNTLNGVSSRDSQVVRAGFAVSKVTLSNRVIERQPTANGYFWTSYDFRSLVNRADETKDVFSDPLGPVGIYAGPHAFRQDASEIFFSLPNGLTGYFVADANGNSLAAALLDIAQDPSRRNRVVTNGFSCMNCHGPGILQRSDELASTLQNRGAFSADELTFIGRLYGPQDALDAAYAADNAEYRNALSLASFDPSAIGNIVQPGYVYEQDVDMATAAAVVGLSPTDFSNYLLRSSPDLRQELGGFFGSGTVARLTFEADIPKIVAQFFGTLAAP